MISPDFRCLALASVFMCGVIVSAAPADSAVAGTEPFGEMPGESPLSVDNLLQRIDSYRGLSRESAELIRHGLRESASPMMDLELGLLEAFATEPVQNFEQARRRLARALEADGLELPAAVRGLLEFIVVELAGRDACRRDRTRLEGQLILEREAHAETREKLEALRRIDQELEGRDNDTEEKPSR